MTENKQYYPDNLNYNYPDWYHAIIINFFKEFITYSKIQDNSSDKESIEYMLDLLIELSEKYLNVYWPEGYIIENYGK